MPDLAVTDEPAVRRCRRGSRCGLRERDEDGRPVGAALELPGLCPRDTFALRHALHELPELWDALRALVAPSGAAPVDAGTGRSARSALPLRATPLVVAQQVRDELLAWEALVRTSLAMDPPAPARVPADVDEDDRSEYLAASAVARAAELLHDAIPTLLALAPRPVLRWDDAGEHRAIAYLDGVDAACLILELHRRATSAAGRGRLVHFLPMPCPSVTCQRWTLQRDNGEDHVYCATCGRTWPEDRYSFLSRILAADLADAKRCPDCDDRGVLPDDTLCPHPELLARARP